MLPGPTVAAAQITKALPLPVRVPPVWLVRRAHTEEAS